MVALTGGIAAGKSVVSARLAELGAVVVDADRLAREVVEPGTVALRQIAEAFGASMLTGDGALDRAALGAIVFEDPAGRARLNAITHPAVWELARQRFEEAAAADPEAIVIYDVPLLVEASADRPLEFDLVVVVHASREIRIERMVRIRGMRPADAEARVAAQAADEDRLAVAELVIDSSGTLEHTLEQVDDVWQRIRRSALSKHRR